MRQYKIIIFSLVTSPIPCCHRRVNNFDGDYALYATWLLLRDIFYFSNTYTTFDATDDEINSIDFNIKQNIKCNMYGLICNVRRVFSGVLGNSHGLVASVDIEATRHILFEQEC